MTLNVPSPTVSPPPPTKRAYASRQPKWQRFQQVDLVSSSRAANAAPRPTTTAAKNKGGKNGTTTNNNSDEQQHVYQRQYSHVYHQRLSILGPRCKESILQGKNGSKTSSSRHVNRILELREGELSTVVGTLVKEASPDGNNEADGDPVNGKNTMCRDSDELFLEDESGRVALQIRNGGTHRYCSGVVAGVRGTVGADGVMEVDEVYPPSPPPPLSSKATEAMDTSDGSSEKKVPHLLLLSGLQCGGSTVSSLPRDMLVSFLQGRFGTELASKVSHVVVAGGLVSTQSTTAGNSVDDAASKSALSSYSPVSMASSMRELDGFLLQVAASGVPVDVLPGRDDPTTANWPQRPIHSSLLPVSERFLGRGPGGALGIVSRTPNPYAAALKMKADDDSVEETYVVGTDGTNVHDLVRYVLEDDDDDDDDDDVPGSGRDNDNEEETPTTTRKKRPVTELEALEKTLTWSHMCPTGPSSVPTVPHATTDPMVMTHRPDLYFCGNCTRFATTASGEERKTRLVCIPKFAETGEAVLVNLETLDVELLRFEE